MNYCDHPKVKQARKLLIKAAQGIRQELTKQIMKETCKCGHRRKVHCPSYSINYTGGGFKSKGCKCLAFLYQECPI